jgi:hypothetical protein
MWMPANDAPEAVVVMTKIDDGKGVRNEQMMQRIGNLWWFPDRSMYVYYRPTHYRWLTAAEEAQLRKPPA